MPTETLVTWFFGTFPGPLDSPLAKTDTDKKNYLRSLRYSEIGRGADRPDLLRVQADGPPGDRRRVAQGLVALVHSVGPVVGAQIVPEVLHRVQLGRVG